LCVEALSIKPHCSNDFVRQFFIEQTIRILLFGSITTRAKFKQKSRRNGNRHYEAPVYSYAVTVKHGSCVSNPVNDIIYKQHIYETEYDRRLKEGMEMKGLGRRWTETPKQTLKGG